jgi:hypothetical protein
MNSTGILAWAVRYLLTIGIKVLNYINLTMHTVCPIVGNFLW